MQSAKENINDSSEITIWEIKQVNMDLIYHTLVTEFIQNKTKFTVFLEQHNWLWVYVVAQIGQVQVGKGKGY